MQDTASKPEKKSPAAKTIIPGSVCQKCGGVGKVTHTNTTYLGLLRSDPHRRFKCRECGKRWRSDIPEDNVMQLPPKCNEPVDAI